jgi:hypothetical protein
MRWPSGKEGFAHQFLPLVSRFHRTGSGKSSNTQILYIWCNLNLT